MEIIHIVENMDASYGGPAKSISTLAKFLLQEKIQTSIWTTYTHKNEHNDICDKNHIPLIRFKNYGPLPFRFSWQLLVALRVKIQSSSEIILHVHNLWNRPPFVAYIMKLRYPKIQLVVSPRGSIFPWSLQQKKITKKILRFLFQKHMLQKADIVHVTSEQEKNALRNLGIQTAVNVIPNGIELDEFDNVPSQRQSRTFFGLDQTKKYLLFLSRIHPKKGLDILIDSWISLAPKNPDLDLIIAGPIEDKHYWDMCLQKIIHSSLKKRLHYFGEVVGANKIKTYCAADIFVLPSHTENFGIAIAEALAVGLPIVVSDQTPWGELNTNAAGYCVPLSEFPSVLQKVIDLTINERKQIAARGKKYVFATFSFTDIIKKYVHMYDTL